MDTFIKAITSRTNWVIVTTFALNYAQYLSPFISPDLMVLINGILGAFAIYFKLNPSQRY